MKLLKFAAIVLVIVGLLGCQKIPESTQQKAVRDGVFIHVSHGPEDAHRVLMALNMAAIMTETQDVLMYFDITGVNVVLKDAPDIQFSHFPSSLTQIQKLLDQGVTIMACPGCLKAAGKTPEDLAPGIQVANKEAFFNFTKGRILTLDY